MHLINWDTLCMSRKDGGLGLKKMTSMNDAFMMKLGWGVLTKPGELWVQVLRGKYDRGYVGLLQEKMSPTDSCIWKAIAAVWPSIMSNIFCSFGDGSVVQFRTHLWVNDSTRLTDAAITPLDQSMMHTL